MPLTIDLHPSRWLCVALVSVHAIALYFVATPPIAMLRWLQLLLFLAVLASLVFYMRRDGLLRSHDSITRLVWDAQGAWSVFFRDGRESAGSLRQDSIQWPKVLLLGFRLDSGGVRMVVLFPDATSPERWRDLVVRLRIERGSA